MKEILIFSGTTEGRLLSETLENAQIPHTTCVATEYGEMVLQKSPIVKVHKGRMNTEEMKAFICEGGFSVVVDATHPYAELVSRNLKDAINGMSIVYLRLLRNHVSVQRDGIYYFDSNEDCEKALRETSGNILLTTGSKELAKYCVCDEVRDRLFVRVLPSIESITLCEKHQIVGKQIIAMQGPFSVETNEALLRQYDISVLVTKESGWSGGFHEKVEAAKNAGYMLFVIGHPKETEGLSFEEVCNKLEQICDVSIKREPLIEVTLAGMGMGNRNNMTKEVRDAIENAEILLGASRMLKGISKNKTCYPYYLPNQIIPFLKKLKEAPFHKKKKVTILFSGDTGFNSGCKQIYHSLKACKDKGELDLSISVLPGISSVAYLAAHIGENYDDAYIGSIHGKYICNLPEKIRTNSKTFLLMSGVKDLHLLGEMLLKSGLDDVEVIVGYQLSYQEEEILSLSPQACVKREEDGLYICFIRNQYAVKRRLTHGMGDEVFLRDKVPMTKEEVREVSICKLQLEEDAICYDIGSGTGSIAVEIAALSDRIQVYAIEQKVEAVALIQRNKSKMGLENIHIIEAKAPSGLKDLPKPTHTFIGGSGGNMKDILEVLYAKNPQMRIVMNAISMETICEIKDVLAQFPVEDVDIVQIQASRAKQAGSYHLMQAENPVWICAFRFCEKA